MTEPRYTHMVCGQCYQWHPIGPCPVPSAMTTDDLDAAALEQAVRLHLAVAPDDPVLLTPVEQQVIAMRQERDEARSMRDFAKEDRDLYYQRWEAVSRERDVGKAQFVRHEQLRMSLEKEYQALQATLARVEGERDQLQNDQMYQRVIERMEQAEQREARLREALELIATTNHGNYPDNATPYEIGIADGHRCAAKWAQQALSQLSTDLTDQSEAVHKKEPSGSPD